MRVQTTEYLPTQPVVHVQAVVVSGVQDGAVVSNNPSYLIGVLSLFKARDLLGHLGNYTAKNRRRGVVIWV